MPNFDGAAEHVLGARRNADFIDQVTIEGVDWSRAAFACQLRIARDAGGAPLATMAMTEPEYNGSNTIFIRSLPQAAIAALPASPEPGEDLKLYFDMVMSLDGLKTVIDCGEFIVHGRITA